MFSTHLCLSLPSKRVALRFSQRLETWPDFFYLLMLFNSLSTFSIRRKHEEFSLCNLPTAISRVGDCLHACFRRDPSSIRTWSMFFRRIWMVLTEVLPRKQWTAATTGLRTSPAKHGAIFLQQDELPDWVAWPLMWTICTFLFIKRTRSPLCYNVLS